MIHPATGGDTDGARDGLVRRSEMESDEPLKMPARALHVCMQQQDTVPVVLHGGDCG